ncbi:unnamed protein product [Mytilus coruscus]|uniref:Uncharacterized protein n=1 Tax=Mytilus coruscus TaxID=42192 RepID=A0A6J8AZ55_MYTCO|nr:unnamed protein product [Mytilus coruscus]
MTELDNSVQRVDTTIKQIETSVEHVDSAIHRVDSSIQEVGTSVKSIDTTMHNMVTTVQEIGTSNEETTQRINSSIQKLLYIVQKGIPDKNRKPYATGQHIFYLHCKCENTAVVGNNRKICGVQMMDDGRLLFCSSNINKLLICNAENFKSETINLQEQSRGITAITRNGIAILFEQYLEIYDISSKEKRKSIHIPVPQPG